MLEVQEGSARSVPDRGREESMRSWLEPFSPEFSSVIEKGLAGCGKNQRKVAVFDADGTLWDGDIGEAFLRWLIAARKLRNVDYYQDIYAEYEAMVEVDRVRAYAHACQLMAGLPLPEVQDWSAEYAYSWPNYRPAMRDLALGLRSVGVETWIVSASNHWTVNEAGPRAGIPRDCCLGIRTEVVDQVLTDRLVLPVTCSQGKVDAIRKHICAKPLFAFGDSMGDFEMLCLARNGLVVQQHGHLRSELLRHADEREWPVHVF